VTETRPPVHRGQRLVLVRHGETAWSRTGRHTGRSDVPLDAEGVEQAGRLRARMREWEFAEVICSPLERARRTCELAGFGERACYDPETEEWDYGTYEGLTADQIRAGRPGWTIWKDGVIDGESAADLGRRADSVIARLRLVPGDVALFSHGHFLRILSARWCDLPALAGERLALQPGSLSVLGDDRGDPVIWLWNDTGHLTGLDQAR